MNPRKIAILSVILLLLGGFYYFFEVRRSASQKAKAEISKKVLNIDAEQIERIGLKNSKGVLALEKRGEEWFLVEPITTLADTWAVQGIVDTFADGSWEREVTPLPEDVADFGIGEPEIEVTLSVKGISEPKRVLVGAENPAGNMRYVRVNQEERLLLVRAHFIDVLDKNADDLRDKRVIRFKEDAVAKVVWRIDNKSFEAERKENKWALMEPAAAKIDQSRINSLIRRLEGLKFKKIFEKPDQPFSYYGLEKPSGAARLMDQEGKPIVSLIFGASKGPTASFFAKAEGSDTVYELSYDFVNDLPRREETE
jgi:hypothetical protein